MEQRRFFLFLILSMAVLIGYTNFIVPMFFPPPKPVAEQEKEDAEAEKNADNNGDDGKPANDAADQSGEDNKQAGPAEANKEKDVEASEPDAAAIEPAEKPPQAAANKKLPNFPAKQVTIGSLDPESGYFLQATITSRGGSILSVELNDDRYKELKPPKLPLKLLGTSAVEKFTFATQIGEIDRQLEDHETNLAKVNWDLVDPPGGLVAGKPISSVTFRYTSPDGSLAVSKLYRVEKIEDGHSESVRDTEPVGYQILCEQTIENLGDNPQTVTYTLQGPAGVPLENAENTRKYRDVKMAFYEEDEVNVPVQERDSTAKTVTSAEIAKQFVKNNPDVWERAFKYIGVDVQYFTALVIPIEDQLQSRYIAEANPQILGQPEKELTNISFTMNSKPITLKAGEKVTHAYSLYTGPKREGLLAPIGAEDSLDFGWFGFVSKPMLSLLKFLHNLGIPYGISIIILTMIVRGCMYPISRKQAKGAQKMKELQPKIAELKKKYANEKEKMAKAQMELFSKHNYNPFAGCLPVFLQFPIFIGLYQALGNAVDLRAAKFLWIDNLAAPDALFQLGFAVPFVGWKAFNLLPIITIALFILQQKMFMPPAAPDDEQAQMQQKMMKYMMIFMGFLFYKVPAGLCVYFIASSLWGMGERKLLDIQKQRMGDEPEPPEPSDAPKNKSDRNEKDAEPKRDGLWARLVASAEATAEQSKTNGKSSERRGNGKKGKKKSRR